MNVERNGRVLTMTVKEFKRLFDKHTQLELARLLGVSQPAVSYWAKKLGIGRGAAKKIIVKDGK